MKRINRLAFAALIVLVLAACGNRDNTPRKPGESAVPPQDMTSISWADTLIDFGVHKAGEKVPVRFTFTNTGNKPLYVSNVMPGCGCTTGDYTKEAVPPGGQGWVSAIFNSEGYNGEVHKSLKVTTNTPNAEQVLRFTGTIQGEGYDEPVNVQPNPTEKLKADK
jgi:hypothetical protein